MSKQIVYAVSLQLGCLMTAAILSGCGGGDDAPAASSQQPASVIGDPLHEALDRAQSVQDTLDDRAADLRQRLAEDEN